MQDRDVLQRQSVAAFATAKKAANAPRRNSLTPCLSDSRCRTKNGDCLQVPCSPDFWSDVHPPSRSGDTHSPNSASSGAPPSPGVAYGLKGAATLLLRSFDAPGGADEPRAAQAFERPRLSHPHHVPTLCSALVDRAAQNVIYGPILSICIGL